MSAIKDLPAKTLDVLELVFEGKDAEEIQHELGMKPLVYNNIAKRLVKDGLVEDNEGVLEPSDEVVAYFESQEESGEEDTAEEVEEKPAPKAKGKSKEAPKAKTKSTEKAKPAKGKPAKVDVAELETVVEELNKLMDPEQPLESADDVKALVTENTDQFEKDDVKQLSEGVIAYIEAVAKKGKVMLPWQEKAKRQAPKKVDKGPGVVASIIEFLKAEKLTRAELLEKLVERFPDRERKGMQTTVNCQVPKRLEAEKKLKVQNKDGKFFIK